jgi:hypothetical protein
MVLLPTSSNLLISTYFLLQCFNIPKFCPCGRLNKQLPHPMVVYLGASKHMCLVLDKKILGLILEAKLVNAFKLHFLVATVRGRFLIQLGWVDELK